VFEPARHLTWPDREIARFLYDHQVLATGRLELLFFSSRRRCQDRLLFLYRERVIDRLYPHGPFGFGKPQAHWLLDDAGAILVASSLGVEPKRLGWQRHEDWASHYQLAEARLHDETQMCNLAPRQPGMVARTALAPRRIRLLGSALPAAPPPARPQRQHG
jgi:hypothetical protein